jgi:hypothetical protein
VSKTKDHLNDAQHTALGIDPGPRGSGLALVRLTSRGPRVVAATVLTTPRHITDRFARLRWQMQATVKWIDAAPTPYACALVELCEFRPGNAIGHAAATGGDLVDLAALAGALHVLARRALLDDGHSAMIAVGDWKAQLPKPIAQRRINDLLTGGGRELLTSHSWDAAGLALHALGQGITAKTRSKS